MIMTWHLLRYLLVACISHKEELYSFLKSDVASLNVQDILYISIGNAIFNTFHLEEQQRLIRAYKDEVLESSEYKLGESERLSNAEKGCARSCLSLMAPNEQALVFCKADKTNLARAHVEQYADDKNNLEH